MIARDVEATEMTARMGVSVERPVLLIGLGGAGGRTLRLVKQQLHEPNLRRHMVHLPEKMPQMLHIDLPETADAADRPSKGGAHLEPHEYLSLASTLPKGASFENIARGLAAIPGSEYEIEGWLPSVDDLPAPLARVPRRADVRAIALTALPQIHAALSAALTRAKQTTGPASTPIPILVGSLAGATGSAIVRDVLETLDQIDPQSAYLAITILYTPDVFPDNAGLLQARALATISELLNGAWSEWGMDDDDPVDPNAFPPRRSTLRRSLLPGFEAHRANLYNATYLIAATDSRGVSRGRGEATYTDTARLITALVTDVASAESLLAERFAGWAAYQHALGTYSTDTVTNLGPMPEAGLPIFDALGYSRVSGGTEEFRHYAAEVLAAEAACVLAGNPSGESSISPVSDVIDGIDSPRGDRDAWSRDARRDIIDAVEAAAAEHGLTTAVALVRELMVDAASRSDSPVRTLVPSLLEPLLEALTISTLEMDRMVPQRNEWAEWPSKVLLDRLNLGHDALTVIRPEEFPATLGALLVATFGTDEIAARRSAACEIAAGSADGLRLITSAEPRRYRAQGNDAPHSSLPFALAAHCRNEDLLARADQWLAQEDTPIAAFLTHDLRSIVSAPDDAIPGGTTKREREDRLVALVETAFAHCAPRVQLSENLLMRFHPHPLQNATRVVNITRLPFRNHAIEQRLHEVLMHHLPESDAYRWLTQEAVSPTFEIITALPNRVDPMTLSSIMRPIAAQWDGARSRGMMQPFVTEGRARPLDESLPLPTPHLRAMIRGWFTARILGLIDTGADPWTIVLHPRDDPRSVAFPAVHLSGPPRYAFDELPHALESISIAMLDVAATESLAPLDAYRALRDLGMSSSPDGEVHRYPKLSPVLEWWIGTGEVLGDGEAPDVALHPAIASAEDPSTRREALIDLLTSGMHDVELLRNEHLTNGDRVVGVGDVAPRWLSIADHIQAGLAGLLRAAQDHEPEALSI